MRYRKTENTLSLLGGALLGAAAMYVLDPAMGRKRRAYIKDQAGDYLETAQDALHGGWESARDRARGVAHTVADKAQEYSQHLSDLAQDYSERLSDQAKGVASSFAGQASDMGSDWRSRARSAGSGLADTIDDWRSRGRKFLSRYADKARGYAADRAEDASDVGRDYASRASDYSDDITDYAHGLWKQVRGMGKKLRTRGEDAADRARAMAGEEHTPVMPVALTAVGCCAIGVGLMYLMDPHRGRQRRAWLADSLTGWVRNTGQTFYRTGRDVANRAAGTVSSSMSGPSTGPLYSEQLRDRVQAEIGRVAPQAQVVQVMADVNGSVTLTGSVRPEDSDRIIAAVEDVDGVNLVINRLDAGSGSAQSTGGKGVPQM
ncbi:MAG TPA: BON domain-containing protein [Tepidisphaeraceae bacterium]|jgi:gas vesicle protein